MAFWKNTINQDDELICSKTAYFQVEMEKNYHFSFGRREEGMPDVVVQHIHLFSSQCRISEAIDVSFQTSRYTFLRQRWTNRQVFQSWLICNIANKATEIPLFLPFKLFIILLLGFRMSVSCCITPSFSRSSCSRVL